MRNIWLCVDHRPAAGQPALDELLAGEDSSVEFGDEDLAVVAEPLLARVQRANVVSVAVGERYSPDRAASARRSGDELVAGAAGRRIDQCEAVVLAHEISVGQAR